jgi:hypothetical protein
MFTGSPIFVRVRSSRFAPRGRSSWLWLAPGVGLLMLALAIVIWPELLAYLVAAGLAGLGAVLTAWGWAMRQSMRSQEQVPTYRVYPQDGL